MPVTFPTWAEVLHAATNPIRRLQLPEGTTTVAHTDGPVTAGMFVVEAEEYIARVLGEKKDDKKSEKKAKKDDKPKDAPPKAKKDEPKGKAKGKDEAPAAPAPYGKVPVERTPSAMRAAAMTVAAVLGGPGYLPRGETPEAIINYALILYSKTGHVSTVDSVAATALKFATHMGIKWDRRYLDDDLRRMLKESRQLREDEESITKSMYQTNPLLRQQAVSLVALMLLALGYKDAAAEIQVRDDWSLLMKHAQMIFANAQKVGGGRGGEEFEDALKLRFIEMGLIVTEDSAKQALKKDIATQHGKKKDADPDPTAKDKKPSSKKDA